MRERTRTALVIAPLLLLAGSAIADGFVPDDQIISDPTQDLPDPEFDTVSDFVTWQDPANGDLWIAWLDPVTGELHPPDGRGELIDQSLANVALTGNGPEWGYGEGTTYIVYTRKESASTGRLAMAKRDAAGVWNSELLTDNSNRWRPEGTHASQTGPGRIVYNHTGPLDEPWVSWRDLEDPASEGTITGMLPQGGRWVEGVDALLAMGQPVGPVQFYWVDLDEGVPHQITFEGDSKLNPYSWWAPEFDEPVFSAMIDARKVAVFRQTDTYLWERFYTLDIPTDFQFVSSPEAFVHNGKSYIVTVAASELGGDLFRFQPKGPSEIWIAGIDPDNPFFRRVDLGTFDPQRSEPEMYTTADGPMVMYTELDETDPDNKIKLLRRADTGLGPELAYGHEGYGGFWSGVYRDSRNCNCAPYAVAQNYIPDPVVVSPGQNRQGLRQVLDAEGRLFVSYLDVTTMPIEAKLGVYDTDTATELFRLEQSDISSGFINTNAVIDGDGNFLVAGDSDLNKFDANGVKLWDTPVRGVGRSLQFAPDGNVIMFTWNGWTQVIDPSNGALLNEQLLTGARTFPASLICFTSGVLEDCAYIDAPAVDHVRAKIYATLTTENGNGVVEGYVYDDVSRQVTLAWSSVEMSGNVTSPVLSSDFTRIYVQSDDGMLWALDATTGATLWSFDLGFSGAREPVVTHNGYIFPGERFEDAPDYNFIGIVHDEGDHAIWAFQDMDYAPESLAAAGRENRFVLAARRLSDDGLVLLVVHPFFGILSATDWDPALGEPTGFTGVTIRNDGRIYVGTNGANPYAAFDPQFDLGPMPDADGDGITDYADNCLNVANADQRDTDGDQIGNQCDADLDNDCSVNFVDLGLFKADFLMTGDLHSDFNGDGAVNFVDLGLLKDQFLLVPGPSGVPGNLCHSAGT